MATNNLQRRLQGFAQAVGTRSFLLAISLISGLSQVPDLSFLHDVGGEVGVIAVEHFRNQNPPVYKSVEQIVKERPQSKLKLSGILGPEVIPQAGVLVVGGLTLGDCKGNGICQLISHVVPKGSRLIVKYDPGYSRNAADNILGDKRITAAIANIKIAKWLILRECGFYTEFSPAEVTFGLTFSVTLKVNGGQELIFKFRSGATVGTPDFEGILEGFKGKPKLPEPPGIMVSAKGAMIGFWKKALGIPFLSIGNVQAGLTIDPLLTKPPTEIYLGGEIWLGREPKKGQPDDRIKGALFAGLNLGNPFDSYFYCSISKLTVQSIANMILTSKKAPKIPLIGETGLHPIEGNDGVILSYAMNDRQVEDTVPPITIRGGLRIQGKLQILGWYAICDITLDWIKPALDVYLELGPLKIAGGLLKMYKSKTIKDKGPTFEMRGNFERTIVPTITFDAFVSVLGVSRDIHGRIDENGIFFESEMKIWNLFATYVNVLYNHKTKRVRVYGEFRTGGLFGSLQTSMADRYKKSARRRRLAAYHAHSRRLLQRERRLMAQFGKKFRKKVKKGFKKVGNGVKDFGNQVGDNFKEAGSSFKQAGKDFKNGNVKGGFKNVGKGAWKAATAFIPISVKINKISFDMDLQRASHTKFEVEIDVSVKIVKKEIRFHRKIGINLKAPKSAGSKIADDTRHSFKDELQ